MGGLHPTVAFAPRDSRCIKRLLGVACIFACLLAGCASLHAADADREVARLLDDYQARVLGQREATIRQPSEAAGQPQTQPASEPDASGDVLVLDLFASLEIAFTSSRDFLDRREGLYLNGLGFTLTRHNFGPLLNATITYLWSDAEDSVGSDSVGGLLSASQILPTGGNLTLSSSLNGIRENDRLPLESHPDNFDYDSSVGVSLRQPLLRGAGYEPSHEGLTQGKRNLIYDVRSFELFREDFAIRIAQGFYQLVSQKTRLANDEQDYLDAVYDREKAEALRKVDRNQDDDVFRARRAEIVAEDALLASRTAYRLALDDFKILLGRPAATEIQISDDEPEFVPIRLDPRSAVEAAHHNRLDLHTARGQLEDVERQVRLAKNGLLPDLDLSVNYTLASGVEEDDDATPTRWSSSLGLTLEVPLDRKAERNAYRSALIALDRARRDYQLRLDVVERDVLDQLRELSQLEKQIQLQADQVEFEKRAVAVTQIRYESGDADNRDLLEGRQGLVNAQNALIDRKVQHFIARLRLRRDLGVLFIDEKGRWR